MRREDAGAAAEGSAADKSVQHGCDILTDRIVYCANAGYLPRAKHRLAPVNSQSQIFW